MKKTVFILTFLISFNAWAQGQLQNEATGFISYTAGKYVQLAEAVPADKYDWRPESNTRSFAEVFAHTISSNYFFGSQLGAEVPSNINMQSLEKELNTKEKILAALKSSFDFAQNAAKAIEDKELATKVSYPFPGEFTNMSSIFILMTHTNEHLGQLIAYARMNNITPPWSGQGGE